ncbi:MAG: alkaline phosphatase family protein [SAR324 cluster bacterium]|nr:alkaline phosphatase family protein [SAR324 cluster bacterium]MBL7035461.1 alkaline phosphatase family protein [SAR324 cluster bacterium]
MAKNILFIMCDQLRADYLSCAGHPFLETPNIDLLAKRGVRFANAYCQAPLCGPSRASFYTGRYLTSHGALANSDPLKIGELSLGDYLNDLNYRTVLVGKSEARSNQDAMSRLKIDLHSKTGQRLAQGGFEYYEHFAGIYPDAIVPPDLGYNDYLVSKGYEGDNLWENWANSASDSEGNKVSGWQMRNANLPAAVAEEHSETAFTTNRALDFLSRVNENDAWCLHLSYIKPHWPYLAPAPYHGLYNKDQLLPVVRHPDEQPPSHPVYSAFQEQTYSQNFSRDEVRETVIPTYMGLIKQIDDHLGRVFEMLESKNLMDSTLIVFTSDHGDYLGDHWLGEKDLFHEPSVKIPLIVCDPDVSANSTRGSVNHEFVEAVDIVPTFVEFAGGKICKERMEGFSLLSQTRETIKTENQREFTISQIDYSDRGPRVSLNLHPYDCRAHMIRTKGWKYILHEKFRPQLFDLKNDPQEFYDLADDPEYSSMSKEMHEQLFSWFRKRLIRTEMTHDSLFEMGVDLDETMGILIGHW